MKAHCAAGSSEYQRGLVGGNIMMLRKRLYGKALPHGPIKPAPHFSHLEMFGGSKTIEEFRSSIQADEGPKHEDNVKIAASNTDCVSFIKAVTNTAGLDERKKMWEINNSASTNEPLRLTRQKPLKRDQQENNLASMLGLKRKS
jgi:hypothetical protein